MTGPVPEPVDGVPCETAPPAAPVSGPQRRGEAAADAGPAPDDGEVPSPTAAREGAAALVRATRRGRAVAVPPSAAAVRCRAGRP